MLSEYQEFIDIMTIYCSGFEEEGGGKDYRLNHQLRVAQNASRISSSKEFPQLNSKISILAGLFHDIGRIKILKDNDLTILKYTQEGKDLQKNHEKESVLLVKFLLAGKLTEIEIESICQVILHDDVVSEVSVERKVFSDADNLDELGVLNLFRSISYSAYHSRDIIETANYWFDVDRELKVNKLPLYFTKFAKDEALRRITLQDQIMKQALNSGFES